MKMRSTKAAGQVTKVVNSTHFTVLVSIDIVICYDFIIFISGLLVVSLFLFIYLFLISLTLKNGSYSILALSAL